jgi:hypothetical protein
MAVPAQTPALEQVSPVVQLLPSLQVVPAATSVCVQVPAWQVSVVHMLPSSVQVVPSGRDVMTQLLLTSQLWQSVVVKGQLQLVVVLVSGLIMVVSGLMMVVSVTGRIVVALVAANAIGSFTFKTSPGGTGSPPATGPSHAPPKKAAIRTKLAQLMTRTA